MRRPLVVRLRNWVGDVILGLPALRLLEQHGHELHLVARGRWAPSLLAGHGWPVHVQPATLGERVRQLRTLRAELSAIDPGFDRRENAVVLPQSFSSALEMRLAGLKAVGYGHEGRSLLLARAEAMPRGVHVLQSYWQLAQQVVHAQAQPPAELDWRITPQRQAEADELLERHALRPGYLLICPFAGGLVTGRKLGKKWPHFPAFVQAAAARFGRPIVVSPGPSELDEARSHYGEAVILAGTDLGTYGGLMRRAALVVANDTGPGHMAAAIGAPLLSVLGPTDPGEWGPWGPQVRVVRLAQPDEPDGQSAWPTVEQVLDEAARVLNKTAL
jgi:ADP-heptose:LPS heptosyltransferase